MLSAGSWPICPPYDQMPCDMEKKKYIYEHNIVTEISCRFRMQIVYYCLQLGVLTVFHVILDRSCKFRHETRILGGMMTAALVVLSYWIHYCLQFGVQRMKIFEQYSTCSFGTSYHLLLVLRCEYTRKASRR